MKDESVFYKHLRNNWPAHWVRIENNESVPDVNVAWKGVNVWMELKMFLTNGDIVLRKGQYGWLKMHAIYAQNAYVVAYHSIHEKFHAIRARDLHSIGVTYSKYVMIRTEDSHQFDTVDALMSWIQDDAT